MSSLTRSTDLADLERAVWSELEQAVQGGRAPQGLNGAHAWRCAALATHSSEGPQVRTVVLRDLLPEPRQLVFYSDARAAKVRELREDPRAQLVCWSATLGWQLRLRCTVQIETDGLDVTARWADIRHRRAAQDYLAPLAPGLRLPAAGGQPLQCAAAIGEGVDRHHFAVLYAAVQCVDWLELHPEGHRRARLASADRAWLVP